jgi:site-specific DNA-adenine methylase
MRKLFKYSGCKTKLLQFYRRPPEGTKRIVEPYLGSGAYILSTDMPGLGYEINEEVVAMWRWLRNAKPEEIRQLDKMIREAKQNEEKPDVKTMGLQLGPQTYVRVNATSVVTGQLKSWKIYPQHNLPAEDTIVCLPQLQNIEVIHGNANDYVHQDGDLLFIDPPYVGTDGGYQGKSKKIDHGKVYNPDDTKRLISSTTNPIIFTYGDGAQEIFSEYKWEHVKTAKVPNMRKGGTTDRSEWVSYINW